MNKEIEKEVKEDIAIIRRALSEARQLFEGMRYGGTAKEYQHAKEAIEALKRIEEKAKVQQLRLF